MGPGNNGYILWTGGTSIHIDIQSRSLYIRRFQFTLRDFRGISLFREERSREVHRIYNLVSTLLTSWSPVVFGSPGSTIQSLGFSDRENS